MVKIIDMSGFDPLLDNLEKYVSKVILLVIKQGHYRSYYIVFSIAMCMEY